MIWEILNYIEKYSPFKLSNSNEIDSQTHRSTLRTPNLSNTPCLEDSSGISNIHPLTAAVRWFIMIMFARIKPKKIVAQYFRVHDTLQNVFECQCSRLTKQTGLRYRNLMEYIRADHSRLRSARAHRVQDIRKQERVLDHRGLGESHKDLPMAFDCRRWPATVLVCGELAPPEEHEAASDLRWDHFEEHAERHGVGWEEGLEEAVCPACSHCWRVEQQINPLCRHISVFRCTKREETWGNAA